MSLKKELVDEIVKVTSKAAISCHKFIGKNDKINADKAATDTMREEINKLKQRDYYHIKKISVITNFFKKEVVML